jgi:hypothetical protein
MLPNLPHGTGQALQQESFGPKYYHLPEVDKLCLGLQVPSTWLKGGDE